MPVVNPCRKSTETVKAVPSGASFDDTIGSRRSRRASSEDSGAQTIPDVWRMMNAIFSGVHNDAATNKSPSFSRSSSSVTTTISPRRNASMTAPTRCWDSSTTHITPLAIWGVADLAAVTQIMIGKDASHHGFADRYGTDADTRIMPAFGDDLGFAALIVDRGARIENRRCRFDCKADDDRLSG